MTLFDRLDAAIMAAPEISLGGATPLLDKDGLAMPTLADAPGFAGLDDYHPITICPGYTEPANAVEVPLDDLGALIDEYGSLLYLKTNVWPSNIYRSRYGTLVHEEYHGAVFEALGAEAVFGGMCFGVTTDELGRTGLAMTPYTVAPDVETFKLGAAAMLLAPPDPSEGDFSLFRHYGCTPSELHTKIDDHNRQKRKPYIPPSQYMGL